MTSNRRCLPRAVAALAGLTPIVGQAQLQGPQIEIDFIILATSVPLSPGLAAAAAVILAFAAWWALRRARRSGRVSSWLLVAATAGALVAATPNVITNALAFAFPLTTSPALDNIVAPPNSASFTFAAAAGGPIQLTGVKLNNPGLLLIDQANTTCKPGLVLAPNAVCNVTVMTSE